jgi:hypothetical protein
MKRQKQTRHVHLTEYVLDAEDQVFAAFCADPACRAQLKLGKSNDAPPDVRMEIRAALIAVPVFDYEMRLVRMNLRRATLAESAAFALAFRADRNVIAESMPRHGTAGWLAYEIITHDEQQRDEAQRREYVAAGVARHSAWVAEGTALEDALRNPSVTTRNAEVMREREPDCRDAEGAVVAGLILQAQVELEHERLRYDRTAKFSEEVARPRDMLQELADAVAEAGGEMTLYGKPASVAEIRAHTETLADERVANAIRTGLDRQAPSGDPGWQTKVWKHIDGKPDTAVEPHPDTLAAPPRSWPPNTGCDPDPEDVS